MLCLCSFKTEQIVGVPPQLDWNVQSSIPIGIRKSLPAGPPLGRSRGRRRIIAGRVFADRFFYGDLDVLSRTPLPGFVRESSLILRFNSGFDGHFYSTPLPLYSLKVRPIRGIARDETHGADHRSAMHMHELRSFRLQQPIIEHRNALNCFWVILVLASRCCVIRVCVCVCWNWDTRGCNFKGFLYRVWHTSGFGNSANFLDTRTYFYTLFRVA